MWTRRTFLASAAALPLAAAPRIDVSRISAITDEIARSSSGAVDFIKQYGLRWVELRSVPGSRQEYAWLPEAELRKEAKLLADNGIGVSFLNTSLLKVVIPGIAPDRWKKDTPEIREKRILSETERFNKRLDNLRQAIAAARIFEVEKVRVFTGWRGPDPMAILPRIAEILNEMAEIAAKEKIHLLIENEGACNVSTCAELVALLKMVPSKWVGINWDPLNGAAQEQPFPQGYDMLPKNRIQNVQIKGKSVLDYPGKLDWKVIFAALAKDGYKGQVGLETHIFGDGQIQASHDSMKAILAILQT